MVDAKQNVTLPKLKVKATTNDKRGFSEMDANEVLEVFNDVWDDLKSALNSLSSEEQ